MQKQTTDNASEKCARIGGIHFVAKATLPIIMTQTIRQR